MKTIDGIVIPTGTFVQDIQRAEKALEYGRSLNQDSVHYIVSGVGPDVNEYFEAPKKNPSAPIKKMDFHPHLWFYLREAYQEGEIGRFGIDINSLTSRGNLIHTFPPGTRGRYAIVSSPIQLWRFKLLEWELKLTGKMSSGVKIKGVRTKPFFKQTKYELIYGIAALAKDLVWWKT